MALLNQVAFVRAFFLCLLFSCLSLPLASCGKYGTPLPPEMYAPRAIADLEVQAVANGVELSWRSPRTDRRGKELRAIDGYSVMRLSGEPEGIITPADYRELAFIPDTHVLVRDALRQEAISQGEIARRVRVDPELTNFSYFDEEVLPGETYSYQVVPVGRGVEGDINRVIKVLFRGELSEVEVVSGRSVGF